MINLSRFGFPSNRPAYKGSECYSSTSVVRWIFTLITCFSMVFAVEAGNHTGRHKPTEKSVRKGSVSAIFLENSGVDLSISKTTDKPQARNGDVVTFTMMVYNTGVNDAHDVVVKDDVPLGTTLLSALPSSAYDSLSGFWNCGTIPSGDTLIFSYTVKIQSNVAVVSEAEVFSMTESDDDSTPNNGVLTEDDWSFAITHIPLFFCRQSEIAVSVEAPPGGHDYKWFKNGAVVSTDSIYIINDFGFYHYEALYGPNNDTIALCCPVEVNQKCINLGDAVWLDNDNNGKRDSNETGLPNVQVILYYAGSNGIDSADVAVDTAYTDANGSFTLKAGEGNYYIKIVGQGVPAGYISSTGDGINDTDGSGPYEPGQNGLNPNEDCGTQQGSSVTSGLLNLVYDQQPVNDDNDPSTNNNIDFGFYKPIIPPASISGVAFLDRNKDGLSTGEGPIAGVVVTLHGSSSASTVTDATGMYHFYNLAPGTYWVTFSVPASLVFTKSNEGMNDSIDSDVDSISGSSSHLVLIAGQNAGIDAGYQDNIAPVFNSTEDASDMVVECDSVPKPVTLTATDEIDKAVKVQFSESITTGNCADNYVVIRTWTAVDSSGNSRQHTQRITVRDTKPPVFISCPQLADITVECHEIPQPATGFEASDNCDTNVEITFKEERTDGSCTGSYTLLRTWVATDNCGNSTTKSQSIRVYDRSVPQFTANLTDIQVSCENVPKVPFVSATDNCDQDVEISFNENIQLGTCSDSYHITRQWVANDDCGNTAKMVQHITVIDNTAPVFSNAPVSVTVNCGDNTAQMPDVSDNCDKIVAVSVSETQPAGDCITGRTITRTYTAIDNCGNTSQFVQTIHIVDNEAPLFVNTPSNITVNCGNVPPPAKVTVKDNCPDAVMIMFDQQKTAGDNCSGYGIIRTWTAMDACGNQSVLTQQIIVEGDHKAPVISGVPADASYDCSDVIPYPSVVASDDCDNNPKLTFSEDKLGSGCLYKLIRSWTATDKCGNVTTKLQVILVKDETAPLISGVPADVTIECSDALPPTANPTAIDACGNGAVLGYSQSIQGDVNSCEYQVLRTWTATDNCGNIGSKTQVITVKDTKGPRITPLNPILAGIENGDTLTVECNQPVVMDERDVVVSDDCDSKPTVVFDEYGVKEGNCPVDGYLFLLNCRWTATDKCGNTSVYEFTLKVIDTQAPVFTDVPASITIDCGQVMPPVISPKVSDNCDKNIGVLYSENIVNGKCDGNLEITRRWTATDHCGNVSTATQKITIEDNIAPVITNVPQAATVNCGETPDDTVRPYVFDNCDKNPVLSYVDAISGSGGCLGTVVRTWTATDACGNASTATQTILIIDNQAPVIDVNTSSVVLDCGQPIPATPVSVTDNCDQSPVLKFRETRFGDDCDFKIVREWTATDKCGNESIKVKTITVHDKTAPEISGIPSDFTASCTDPLTPPVVTATDICDKNPQVSIHSVIIGDSTACEYKIIRTWTATDKCGNSTSQSMTITVKDVTAPVITPKNPMLAGIPNGGTLTVECNQVQVMDENDVIVTDDCDKNPVVRFDEYGLRKGNCPVDGYLFLLNCRWTATDKCGNTSIYEFTLKVIDTQAPVISNVPGNITLECDQAVPQFASPTVTDNCDKNVQVVYTETIASGQCSANRLITRVWTATDHCGNVSSATQTITIEDKTAPVISNVPQSATVNCGVTPDDSVRPGVTDNCDKDPVLTYQDNFSTDGGCVGTVVRTWTATDACGNVSTAIQSILIIDTEAPVINVNTTSLVLDCGQPVPDTPANVTDNCDPNPKLQFRESSFGDDCNFKIVREWIATDKCGNETIKVKTITVHDTTAPVISGIPTDFTTNCSDPLTPPVVTVTDICDKNPQVSMQDSVIGDPNSCQYLVVRTWTATDKCGNSSTRSMTITVKDLSSPVIVPKSPMLAGVPSGSTITIECDQLVVMTENDVIVTDDCDKNTQVRFDEYGAKIGDCKKDGYVLTITCRWTATDKCGNTAVYEFTVIAKDTKAPVISGVPDNITLDCKATLPPVAQVSAKDNCTKDVSVTYTELPYASTGCVLPGSVVRSWTATDDCGNSSVKTQLIIFTDNQKPVIIGVHADVTLNPGETEPQFNVKAVDNCDADVQLTVSSIKTETNCAEITAYTYTATDDCGNVATSVYTVTRLKSTDLQASIDVITSDELCGGKNGTAKLSPASFTYTWNDGFVGSERNNLTAGQYQVTVSDQCASKVISINIGSECPCVVPEIVSTVIVPAGCGGIAVGSIEFGMKDGVVDDYVYVWSTANGDKTRANGLTSGDYRVMISRKANPNCTAKFSFTVGEKQSVNVFDVSDVTVEINDCPNGKALVCSQIKPSDLTSGAITVTDNGIVLTSSFKGCKFDTVYYYSFTLIPGSGNYVLKNWSVGGQVLTGEFNTLADLLALMNGFDPLGGWKISQSGKIYGGRNGVSYGSIEIRSKVYPNFAQTSNPDLQATARTLGIELSQGVHHLVATSKDGCQDSIKVTVTCKPLPPVCTSFISATVQNVFGPCGVASRLCIPDLPFADISSYSISDNGAPYSGSVSSCGNGTGLTLTNGIHVLIFTSTNGCKDTLTAKVTCTSAKYVIETIQLNQKDTVCLDLAELLGSFASIENIWPTQSGTHARFGTIPGSSCITCLGVNAGGTDKAAFVITDEHGVRDTTFFEITVVDKNAKGPDAIEDRAKMNQGDVMILDVLSNDKLGSANISEIRIVKQPKNAFVFVNPENKVVFTPAADFCDDNEDEEFVYKICTKEGCDEAPVLIKVQCSGIKVYTGFSPNGDGVNDTFVIEGAADQSNNKLSIFNRYGNQVYFKEGYKNDWNGTWEGRNLPDGTYYYLYDDGRGEAKAGYIQILR